MASVGNTEQTYQALHYTVLELKPVEKMVAALEEVVEVAADQELQVVAVEIALVVGLVHHVAEAHEDPFDAAFEWAVEGKSFALQVAAAEASFLAVADDNTFELLLG